MRLLVFVQKLWFDGHPSLEYFFVGSIGIHIMDQQHFVQLLFFCYPMKVQYAKTQTYNRNTTVGCESIIGSLALHGIELGGITIQACTLLIIMIGYHILVYRLVRRMNLGV